jgi:hypothetical protein
LRRRQSNLFSSSSGGKRRRKTKKMSVSSFVCGLPPNFKLEIQTSNASSYHTWLEIDRDWRSRRGRATHARWHHRVSKSSGKCGKISFDGMTSSLFLGAYCYQDKEIIANGRLLQASSTQSIAFIPQESVSRSTRSVEHHLHFYYTSKIEFQNGSHIE